MKLISRLPMLTAIVTRMTPPHSSESMSAIENFAPLGTAFFNGILNVFSLNTNEPPDELGRVMTGGLLMGNILTGTMIVEDEATFSNSPTESAPEKPPSSTDTVIVSTPAR